VSKEGIQADISELVSDVTRLLSLKRQIAVAGGKPLAFMAVAEETEDAYAAVAVQAAGKSQIGLVYSCTYPTWASRRYYSKA